MIQNTMRHSVSILLFFLVAYSVFANSAKAENNTKLLKALASGNHFALLRHALAPGTGDPEHFDLTKCDTQRNLNAAGRIQAGAIGEMLRTSGIDQAQLYSSQWCRCMETAQLLQMGAVDEMPALNSFYQARHNQESQTRLLRSWLSDHPLEQAVILVTHQVNITALTGIFVASGELLIVNRLDNTELQVIGTIKTAQ